jgi:hypothetical protein
MYSLSAESAGSCAIVGMMVFEKLLSIKALGKTLGKLR